MQSEKTNSSPEQTPESIEKKDQQLAPGELKEGAVTTESNEELPVFKLHVGLEAMMYIKAPDIMAAKEILKAQPIGNYTDDNHITFFEEIPHSIYKDFKVEILDK